MCSNRPIADCLEGFMDDMINNFEDFVKKSLILLSLAAGLILLMLLYVVKMMTRRTPCRSLTCPTNEATVRSPRISNQQSSINIRRRHVQKSLSPSVAVSSATSLASQKASPCPSNTSCTRETSPRKISRAPSKYKDSRVCSPTCTGLEAIPVCPNRKNRQKSICTQKPSGERLANSTNTPRRDIEERVMSDTDLSTERRRIPRCLLRGCGSERVSINSLPIPDIREIPEMLSTSSTPRINQPSLSPRSRCSQCCQKSPDYN